MTSRWVLRVVLSTDIQVGIMSSLSMFWVSMAESDKINWPTQLVMGQNHSIEPLLLRQLWLETVKPQGPHRAASARISAFSLLSMASRFLALSVKVTPSLGDVESRRTNGRPPIYTAF